jgi:hypothetical protein
MIHQNQLRGMILENRMKKIIHHIRHIRNQPEQTKRHILHALTVICGVILLSLWVYSLGTNFTNTDNQAKVKSGLEPFSAIKDNFVDGYKSITE